MKARLIQMYRTCQYGSWEEAERVHGVRTVVWTDTAFETIYATCDMMDGGYRVDTRIINAPDGFVEFYKEFSDAFGFGLSIGQVLAAIIADDGHNDQITVRDAWILWKNAIKFANSRGAVPTTGSEPSRGEIGNPTPLHNNGSQA
jgi:hypothetical protein